MERVDSHATPSVFHAETHAERLERIDKPFANWDPLDLDAVIDTVVPEIAKIYSQERNEELFKQAALPLSDIPMNEWVEQHGMKDSDKQALEYEKMVSFWDQPLPLRTTYLMLFMSAIVQGWSQTGTNAANLLWPRYLLPEQNTTGADSCGPLPDHLWVYAGVNAAPYFAASLGCFFSDPLSEQFYGRRPAIAISALFVFIAGIGSACADTWRVLLGFRVLLGLGMGCKAAVVPVFMAEISPAHLRGPLVMNWQVFDTIGILLGFAANVVISALVTSQDMVWRLQVASLCIPSFALLCGVTFICWDSPRFLMRKEEARKSSWEGLKKKAGSHSLGPWDHVKRCFMPSLDLPYRSPTVETFRLLRGELILAYKEILLTHCQTLMEIDDEKARPHRPTASNPFSLPTQSRWLERLWGLWSWEITHREAKAAGVVMLSQQLCGINTLIFYSSSLFCKADANSNSADSLVPLMLSLLLGLLNFLFALPAYRWIETHGRRWLLVFTIPFLVVFMTGAAASFHSHNDQSRLTNVAVFTSLFMVFYSPGLGPVPFTYSSEVFSLEQRMVGMSFAVFVNFLFAGLFTLFVPIIAETSVGNVGLLGIFAGLNVLAFILVWRYVPELIGPPIDDGKGKPTRSKRKTRSMERLYNMFKHPLEHYRNYQSKVYVPYVLKCWAYFFTTFPPGRNVPVMPDPDYDAWLGRTLPR